MTQTTEQKTLINRATISLCEMILQYAEQINSDVNRQQKNRCEARENGNADDVLKYQREVLRAKQQYKEMVNKLKLEL